MKISLMYFLRMKTKGKKMSNYVMNVLVLGLGKLFDLWAKMGPKI